MLVYVPNRIVSAIFMLDSAECCKFYWQWSSVLHLANENCHLDVANWLLLCIHYSGASLGSGMFTLVRFYARLEWVIPYITNIETQLNNSSFFLMCL